MDEKSALFRLSAFRIDFFETTRLSRFALKFRKAAYMASQRSSASRLLFQVSPATQNHKTQRNRDIPRAKNSHKVGFQVMFQKKGENAKEF